EAGSSTNIEMRDPAMRHRAAENDRVQLILHLHVGNIGSAPAQEPEVFDTLDRLADEGIAFRLIGLAQNVTHRIAWPPSQHRRSAGSRCSGTGCPKEPPARAPRRHRAPRGARHASSSGDRKSTRLN